MANLKLFNVTNLIPILSDVSLRDGLQSLTIEHQRQISLDYKIKIYHEIVNNYSPINVEIGSIVSNKLLPVFNDTIELFGYVEKVNIKNANIKNANIKNANINKPNHYLLIPCSDKLKKVIGLQNTPNFSFITSVSNSFQLKNTNKTLRQNISDLKTMLRMIDQPHLINSKTKLYVSCISECPIEGKIDKDEIVEHLLFYNSLSVDTICLADTCGTLTLEDFSYIITTCINNNINPNKLSLHLHVKQGNEDTIESIIHYALSKHIIQFDVSMLDMGGCPTTLNRSQMLPNVSYDLFAKCFKSYMDGALKIDGVKK
jgi:hydroxymethylglutaryl-CoA lyase